MATILSQKEQETIELRQQAHYWKAQHQKAVEREKILRQTIEEQAQIIRQQSQQIKVLTQENQDIKAELAIIKKMLFGDKKEKISQVNNNDTESEGVDTLKKLSKGQQKGSKGHGRKTHENLETEEIFHDLTEDQKCCSLCGKSHKRLNFTEDSCEITMEVSIKRIIHRRYQYKSSCQCQNLSGLIVAATPLKLFPKTKFSINFWIYMLMEKFLYQRPSHRSLHYLRLEGLAVSQGTITGGFEKIHPMIVPLYAAIVERSRAMKHWHMDETRWLVFANNEGDKKRCWLWVMVNKETCVYVIDPTRSRNVVLRHLGEDPEGIISSDRYSVYQNICKTISFAYCWAHLRRDFIRIYDSRKKLRPWAQMWIDAIANVYKLNNQRLKEVPGSKAFRSADKKLRESIDTMYDSFKKQIQDPDLHQASKKVLISLKDRWNSYCTFINNPQIPMDNNFAERMLRNPVVGRKNYYGSGSLWSATLAAMMFSLLQTLILHNIHPRKFLEMYFLECAKYNGKYPDNPESFLPWNLSDELKTTLSFDSS